MPDPDLYVLVTCAECETLILKLHTTPASAFTAYSYRSTSEISKAPRHAASDSTALCSQCREKTMLKDRPK